MNNLNRQKMVKFMVNKWGMTTVNIIQGKYLQDPSYMLKIIYYLKF